jgi:hypothetical protein
MQFPAGMTNETGVPVDSGTHPDRCQNAGLGGQSESSIFARGRDLVGIVRVNPVTGSQRSHSDNAKLCKGFNRLQGCKMSEVLLCTFGNSATSSQGVLLDAFPVEKQGVAMTLFGLAALLEPVVGATLGGWITDSNSWRWCSTSKSPSAFWHLVPVMPCCGTPNTSLKSVWSRGSSRCVLTDSVSHCW